MIERIYAKNFRRIGECDIRLRDGLTVLMGKNGTGKSTIVEAVTFNFYAKIKDGTNKDTVRRKGAQEDDPTLTVVDFKLGDTYYRCRRGYTKKMSTVATLYSFTEEEYEELQKRPILELDKDLGELVADSTTGVTAAMTELLGVSFEGFKASFIAQQKELDAFSGLAAERRKKFFLNLLGYSALDGAKPELSAKVKSLNTTIESLEGQNLNVDEIQRRIRANEKAIAGHDGKIEKGKGMLEDVEGRLATASTEYEEARGVLDKFMAYQADIERLESEKGSIASEREQLEARIKENADATKDFDASTSIADQLHSAQERARKNKEALSLKSEREKIEIQVKDLQKEIEQDSKKADEIEERTKDKPDVDTPNAQVMELKSQWALLDAKRGDLDADARRLEGLISSVDAGQMAKCPTCGNSIANEQGREHLSRELEGVAREQADVAKRLEECAAEGKEARKRLEIAQRAAATYEEDKRALAKLRQKMEGAQRDLSEKGAKAEELARRSDELSGSVMTQKEEFLLNEEIRKLTEQKADEDRMRSLVTQLAKDRQALALRTERAEAIEKELAEKGAYIKENRKKAQSTDKKASVKQELEQKVSAYRARLSALSEERAGFRGALDADKGNLEKAISQSEQLADLKARLENAISAQQVVETLRKELPARIAPRLSDVAGHILDVATNGRYSMIELDEQYDVNIYTDDDIRSIAQMSGGEADVISLSLRIAIAKILLEASGMPTQTFILDEIFGALDDERRESTCTALSNIQDELSKILCITHIDEIKDMADYAYVVEMDENGVSWVREQVNTPIAAGAELKKATRALRKEKEDSI